MRGRVHLERVAPVGVDVPPDDVTALESGNRADEDPAVTHDEIVALDQQEAEIAGEIGLLVVGEAQRTRAEDSDPRLRALSGGFQSRPECPKERREPLDVELRVEVGKGLGNDEAIF